ncbi:Ribonuclease H1 [Entomophthora muscae]|uniref:Ribonuclease H1 n=1 Tax=Entomophthora muscae TaxID=34485 RepID=A0ACC2TE37_9FUNG|nr:Ribonuclease H1 [Entomophthora muscae]
MNPDRSLVKRVDIKLHLKLQQDPIIVYVDGSFFPQGDSSVGCGIGVFFGQESCLNEAAPLSSVTKAGPRSCFRAEIAAAVRALQILAQFPSYPIIIRSDSLVLVSTMTTNKVEEWMVNRWKNQYGKTVRNWDLLEELLLLIRRRDMPVLFEHVKAHASNTFNNMADWLAKQGAQIDIGYCYLPPIQP